MKPLLPLLALASLALNACTIADGSPWGRAYITLEASAERPDGASDGDRYTFDTLDDYRVTIMGFGLIADAITLGAGEGTHAPVRFDPANPPPGYSLCHGGHCHADDGSLVDYEDIADDLAGGDGEPASSGVTQFFAEEALPLSTSPATLTLAECTARCELPRGDLHHGELAIHGINLAIKVQDLRTGQAQRLADDLVFSGELHLHQTLELALDERFDRGEDPNLGLTVELRVLSSLWEGISWDEVSTAPDLGEALEAVLSERFPGDVDVRTTTERWR